MKKIKIAEFEKTSILNSYVKNIPIVMENVVISDWLSPDERYVIFLDELYDLENKTKLGDIWKKPDNLILFLEHTFKVSKLRKDVKEHASTVLNKNILKESNEDLTEFKPIIKQYLNEGFWEDTWIGKGLGYAGKFIKDTAKDTVSGVYNFGKDLVKGGIDLGGKILRGEWSEVLNLLKKGVKWLARKIRQAIYSPVGIIVDTILIVTGVGKVAQVVVWAIVVCLDIYEFITGDYENKDEPMWLRVVFFLVDIMGLVFAGLAAKGARTAIQTAIHAGGGEIAGLERAVAKNPTFRGTIIKMIEGLKSLPSKLSSFVSILSKTSFGGLLKMGIDGVSSFIKWITKTLVSSWKSPELSKILKVTGLVVGIGGGVEALKDYNQKKNQEQKIKDEEEMKKDEEEMKKNEEEIISNISNKHLDYSSLL